MRWRWETVNGDGIPDLATANQNDGTVLISLGNGDGTFAAKSTPSVAGYPESVAVGDFNGDGIHDLAITNYGDSGAVTILVGNGDGTFTLKSTPSVGFLPYWVVVGDFNRDGVLDLATGNLGDGTLSILLGNGDGTFTLKSSPTVAGSWQIAVADFNGDGIPDLAAVANDSFRRGKVTILAGNGDGTFTVASSTDVGSYPTAIAAADFDGDGLPEPAAANSGGNTVSVLQSKLVSIASAANVIVPGGGTHHVFAKKAADATHIGSTSTTWSVIGTKIETAIALSVSPGLTVTHGTTVQLTTAVAPDTYAHYTAGGDVTFYDDGIPIGTGSVANGQASFVTNTLTVGTHQISAAYPGDANFIASLSPEANLTVQ